MRRIGRMGRSSRNSEEGLKRGTWLAEEDEILARYVSIHGEGKWKSLPKRAGLKRCGKSCRLRWLNYLRPNIKRGNISEQEEDLIIRLHRLLGNRWSLIAGRLPGRTDNEIKNYWNTTLWRKIQGQPLRAPKKSQPFFETSIQQQNSVHEARNHGRPSTPRALIENIAEAGLQEIGDGDVAGTEFRNGHGEWMVGAVYENLLLDEEERDNHIVGHFQSVTSFLDSEWM